MRFTSTRAVAVAMLAALAACSDRSDARTTHDSTIATANVHPVADTSIVPPPATSVPAQDSTSITHSASTAHAAAPIASARPAPPAPPARSGPRHVAIAGVDLTGIGYDQGSVNAPVVVIDFSDFGCPYCAQFTRETYPVIEREYVKTGKVFFKYVPFVVGMFPHAAEATRVAECVGDQGRFWAMADHLYEAQSEWKRASDPRPLLVGIAGVVGADTGVVSQCYRDGRSERRTARANDAANTLGVRVTPSFLVNERPIQGALPLAEFRKVIDAALLLEQLHRQGR